MIRASVTSLTLLLLLGSAALAQGPVGAEFAALERHVAAHPDSTIARASLARAYAASGFVEEAVTQYLAVLSLSPEEAGASPAVEALLQQRMPTWLPKATAKVSPFPLETLALTAPAPGMPPTRSEFLLTTEGFAAHEGERQDRLHAGSFPRVAYGYVWDQARERYDMTVRVHSAAGAPPELAQASLKTVLALYGIVREQLQLDPTRKKGPIDLWLCDQGTPGGRTAGSSIYLYSTKTERAPEEWLREVAHEYGHLALPGIGGFTKTDDPWADGDLGELLFVKWLAAANPDWLPWPVAAAEREAAARRAQLMEKAAKPDATLLAGVDAKARDHFLGLALHAEATEGPRFLADVLTRCPRGNPRRFVAETERLGRARGVPLWVEARPPKQNGQAK